MSILNSIVGKKKNVNIIQPALITRPGVTGKIVKEVKMICADAGVNAYKYWLGEAYDSGDVYAEWGRVGAPKPSSGVFQGGVEYIDKKVKEKLKKGYTEAKVVKSVVSAVNTVGDLKNIANAEIAGKCKIVTELVNLLVKENVHMITSATGIVYNGNSGVFQTPLGIVTQEGIDEAREILSDIHDNFAKLHTVKVQNMVCDYLRIIPTKDIGFKKLVDRIPEIFPDINAVLSQSQILDALEASYKTINNGAVTTEKVFNVSLTLCSDAETKRIQKLFNSTAQSIHGSVRGMKIARVFEVSMPARKAAFDSYGKKLSNQMELWHGTGAANILNILRTGYKVSPPSTVKIAGKLFGNGIYFSDQSTKSLQYCTNFWSANASKSGRSFMFLNQVAMGNYQIPKGQTSSPPSKGYDSYFAQPGKSFLSYNNSIRNNEMIIFNENQVVITHLVEFL